MLYRARSLDVMLLLLQMSFNKHFLLPLNKPAFPDVRHKARPIEPMECNKTHRFSFVRLTVISFETFKLHSTQWRAQKVDKKDPPPLQKILKFVDKNIFTNQVFGLGLILQLKP